MVALMASLVTHLLHPHPESVKNQVLSHYWRYKLKTGSYFWIEGESSTGNQSAKLLAQKQLSYQTVAVLFGQV
jgi:hypothetical protein